MFTLDPGFTSTASCESQITLYRRGCKGILLHSRLPRSTSWPRKSSFLEVCYLLLHGELPNADPAPGLRENDHAAHHACTRSSTASLKASAAMRTRWR